MCTSNKNQWHCAPTMPKAVTTDLYSWQQQHYAYAIGGHCWWQWLAWSWHCKQWHMTAFGDSVLGEGRCKWDHPVAGIGQGNGAGLQNWAMVCTPLFDTWTGLFPICICSTLSSNYRALVGFAFVDDMGLCILGHLQSATSIAATMQQSVLQWEGLLKAMGGALVPLKCFRSQWQLEIQPVQTNKGKSAGSECSETLDYDQSSGTTWSQMYTRGLVSPGWK